MSKNKFTNAELAQIDWAQADRSALLRGLHGGPAHRSSCPAAGVPMWRELTAGPWPLTSLAGGTCARSG